MAVLTVAQIVKRVGVLLDDPADDVLVGRRVLSPSGTPSSFA